MRVLSNQRNPFHGKKNPAYHCSDEPGLIAKITNICYKHQLNIIHNNEFVDNTSGHFFMRTELEGNFNDAVLMEDLEFALPKGASKKLVDSSKKKVVILVTKEAHCLGDILIKTFDGTLNIDIAAIVGNYDTLQPLAEKFDIPFRHVSHEGLNRDEHEAKLCEAINEFAPDYLVLAKYMRILNPGFVAQYRHKIINIHHSFLPAFIGLSHISKRMSAG